ncbi:MAG: class I SAM-dependent methyltransferase [Alphaproteobacteria bacterium]|nr:class I SAM-dependent methyltransferase [Alphaproteobacteria bacterium]
MSTALATSSSAPPPAVPKRAGSSAVASAPVKGGELDFWSKRYSEEGHIWGDEPSETALQLLNRLDPVSKVLEIGFGYGRDLNEIIKHGHFITGIELAAVGLTMANSELRQHVEAGKANLILGDFSRIDLNKDSMDGVLSHRTLHLLGNNGLVRAFTSHAARVLKPNGLLVVSARDQRDFNEDQMFKREDGFVEYKNRPGHVISLWDKERFKSTFSRDFDIVGFKEGEEIESQKNPVPSYFTIMVAKRKSSDLSLDLG